MEYVNHGVFDLKAHLVLVTKYRRTVLSPTIREKLQEIYARLLKQWGCDLIEFGGEADHVHLLLTLRPDIQPSKLINNLKTVSSRLIRRQFASSVQRFYQKPVLWSRSYCLISCGGASIEVLKKYIEAQGADEP